MSQARQYRASQLARETYSSNVWQKPGTEDRAVSKTAKILDSQSLLLVNTNTHTHTHTHTSLPYPFLILQQLHNLSPVNGGSKTRFYGK